MSQLYYRRTDNSSYRDRIPLRIVRSESELSPLEKAYLGAVEKGDYASVKQALEVRGRVEGGVDELMRMD